MLHCFRHVHTNVKKYHGIAMIANRHYAKMMPAFLGQVPCYRIAQNENHDMRERDTHTHTHTQFKIINCLFLFFQIH